MYINIEMWYMLVQTCVSERDAEVREVLENYNNLERECAAARQSVAPELRDSVQRLRDEWDTLRARAAATRDRAPLAAERTASPAGDTARDSPPRATADTARDSARDTARDSARDTAALAAAEAPTSDGSRKSSLDSQHSGECSPPRHAVAGQLGVT